MAAVIHWDDVESRRQQAGHLDGEWSDLGRAAGSVTVGVQRIRVAPGRWSTPAHVEHGEEEIFYVLAGSGLSWQDGGDDPHTYEIGPGDVIVHAVYGELHTLHAGPEGLDVLAFGQRALGAGATLPRAGVAWVGPTWTEVGGGATPWEREAAAGPPPLPAPPPRPATIVNARDVEPTSRSGATVARDRRDLGRAAGSEATGLKLVDVPAGKLGVAPHCHSAEEEIFVVLAGDGAFVVGEEEHSVRAGHVAARPAGTGVAHSVRAGADGITYLAYGTRDPRDVCWYPRSGKVFFRGIGLVGRIEPLDYWDGED